MMNVRLGKKAIAVIVIVLTLVLVGGGFGITYGVMHRKLKTPNANVVRVNAEPDYTIDLSWEKVSGAISYTVQYKYALYPNEIFTASAIGGTSLSVKMVKGELQYRIKSVGKYASNTSDYSEWKSYEVEPLSLDTFRGFNFKYVAGKGHQIDMDTFYPVTYMYKGSEYAINYYEIAIHSTDEGLTEEEYQFQTYSLTQFEEGITFNFQSGKWICYIRPVLYVEINGIKDYSQIEGLYELYNENIDYTVIELIV